MIRSSAGRRCGFVAAIAGLVVGTAGLAVPAFADPSSDPTGPSAAPKESSAEVLSSHDLDLLADAEAAGKRQVTLLIAADRGETADVAAAVDELGGTVAEQFNKVGYLRVSVPTGKVLKHREGPRHHRDRPRRGAPGARTRGAADDRPAGRRTGQDPVRARAPPLRTSTPTCRPTRPARSTFRKAHPTWDGRGVTIGILDSGVDLDHPALADHLDRRAQDRRLGDRHRPDPRRRPDLAPHGHLGDRPVVHHRRRHLDGARGRLQVQPLPREHHRGQRAGRRRQPRR